ncbi:hypothetical protein [Pseudocitrobacter cyperus]|uniref:Lipoprotein n=1 Tax=Pseudocitrobacter cyperus TaxID=3112843 RepID=A0ABV0HEJ9_9ENTR
MKKFAMIVAIILATATVSGCAPWWGHGGPGGHGGSHSGGPGNGHGGPGGR